MSATKIKRLIKLLMPTLLAFSYFIYFDYYFLPVKTTKFIAVGKTIENKSFYIYDIKGKKHQIDLTTYINCETDDEVTVKESAIFHHIKSIEIPTRYSYTYFDLEALDMSLFFITVLFLLWLLLKKIHEYLYYLFFIPFVVLNLFIWGYLIQFKY